MKSDRLCKSASTIIKALLATANTTAMSAEITKFLQISGMDTVVAIDYHNPWRWIKDRNTSPVFGSVYKLVCYVTAMILRDFSLRFQVEVHVRLEGS